MLDWLGGIFDVLTQLGELVLWAIVSAINVLIAACGLALGAFLSLLPAMPTPPAAPVAEWVGWMNWLFPVAPLLAGLTVCVGLWLVYLVVRIPLRWLKAL
ncbi:MAG: hypothetical protein JHC95_12570 [Solirubrobacteraceae bacterium]|nr:hypothetical protein [Solirubrobacteraceae bacterium]